MTSMPSEIVCVNCEPTEGLVKLGSRHDQKSILTTGMSGGWRSGGLNIATGVNKELELLVSL